MIGLLAFALVLLLAGPVRADMYQDASNAVLPMTLKSLVVGQEITNFTYGSSASPLPIDPVVGYVGSRTTLQVSGAGGTEPYLPMSIAVTAESHLTAGSRGIATGVLAQGYDDGTWDPGTDGGSGAIGIWASAASSRGGVLYAVEARCDHTVTVGGGTACIEVDTFNTVDVDGKYAIAINTTDTGVTTGTQTVNGGATVKNNTALLVQGLGDDGTNWEYILLTIRGAGPYGRGVINPTGSLWRAGGFTAAKGLDWPDMVFTGPAIHTTGAVRLDNSVGTGGSFSSIVLENSGLGDNATTKIVQTNYAGAVQNSIDFIANSASDFKGGVAFSTGNGAAAVERARFAMGTGNFLIGTTTDAGSSKILQVNGNASIAGQLTLTGIVSAANCTGQPSGMVIATTGTGALVKCP